MLAIESQKIISIFAMSILLAFGFIAFSGPTHSSMTGMNEIMTNCPSTHQAHSVCPMTAAKHIAEWQKLFMTTPLQNFMILILLSLAVAYIYIFDKFYRLQYIFTQRFKHYRQEHPNLKLFDFLIAIFAKGILQPKLYA